MDRVYSSGPSLVEGPQVMTPGSLRESHLPWFCMRVTWRENVTNLQGFQVGPTTRNPRLQEPKRVIANPTSVGPLLCGVLHVCLLVSYLCPQELPSESRSIDGRIGLSLEGRLDHGLGLVGILDQRVCEVHRSVVGFHNRRLYRSKGLYLRKFWFVSPVNTD